MSDLPDWIYEGAEVWVHQVSGGWGRQVPRQAKVVRFTNTRIMVEESVLGEVGFSKDRLRGIGKAGDYELIRPDSEKVVATLRTAAVSAAMSDLRKVIRDMESGGRLGWDDLPDAQEAAERIHEASYKAIEGIEKARERYGAGERRDVRR
jgi:hypothetical protein